MRINPDDRVALRIPLAADDPLRAQKLAVLPTGLARGEGDALWGSLGWAEQSEGAEEGAEGEGEGEEGDGRVVNFPPELRLLVGVAAAESVSELFGAVAGAAGGGPGAPGAAWALLARCCDAQLEQLERGRGEGPSVDGAKAAPVVAASARAAIEAQRALLARASRIARARAAAGSGNRE